MPARKSYYKPKLIGDYEFSVVSSSLQKMVRRGKEYEAAYWAYILHQSGYGQYLWRRLSIIASEDVGNGTPLGSILVSSLQQNWILLHKHNKEPLMDKFHLPLQAILFLCSSKKSREVNSLARVVDQEFKGGKRLEIHPDCIDPHTDEGKQIYGRFKDDDSSDRKKKRLDLWFSNWSKVKNLAYPDRWEQELKEILYAKIDADN